MTPAVGDFSSLFALVFIAVALWGFLLGPFISIYCLVRFLRDVRRIAVALDGINCGVGSMPGTPREPRGLVVDREATRIANSMFGR